MHSCLPIAVRGGNFRRGRNAIGGGGAPAWENSPGTTRCRFRKPAREPFYSTWYSYRHNVFAGELEKECELAAQYGMEGIILDGGLYADDGKRGCDFRRDGKASKLRVPDRHVHVGNVRKLGIHGFGVPFIGYSSEACRRSKGKYLNDVKNLYCASLDPRFPEVREYLIET